MKLHKNQKNYKSFALFLTALSITSTPCAFAAQPIIRPFLSTRSVGMGSVSLSTGLYQENFFANPARVIANPETKVTVLEVTAESNANLLEGLSKFSGSLQKIIDNQVGKNLHPRVQLILPAWYLAATGDRKFAIAAGFISGTQADINVSNNYASSGALITDIGPAITFGYKPLQDDSLAVGATLRGIYRYSADANVSFIDMIRGTGGSLSSISNQGAMINFDLGATYRFLKLGEFEFSGAAAAQNLLGGNYNIPLTLVQSGKSPIQQPTSFGLGFAVNRRDWGPMRNSVAAIEVRDCLNNGYGSYFRLLHFGLETHWKSIAVRTGLNQGYWTAGLGFDFHYFNLDFATYGEEIALNVGQEEDRRYTLSMGLHF